MPSEDQDLPELAPPEPRLITRRAEPEREEQFMPTRADFRRSTAADETVQPAPRKRRFHPVRWILRFGLIVALLAVAGYFYARHQVRSEVIASLPQLDGALRLPGLSAPVTVLRDGQGVPHIHAATVDDLVTAQGFVTAQDRLFQMDLLRRHAAGELAELFGPAMLVHDRMQRTLMVRRSAEAVLGQLPPEQIHLLDAYARGVNAEIAAAARNGTLPIEFHVLHYTPAQWTPRDSVLVAMVMFQDLTDTFSIKLAREELTQRLNSGDKAALLEDLYPVGSWRDHPPSQGIADLTTQTTPFVEIPLDSTQSRVQAPAAPLPFEYEIHLLAPSFWRSQNLRFSPSDQPHASEQSTVATKIQSELQGVLAKPCDGCTPGSNQWAISGAHTASGKPLLSNDMHLMLGLPDIWYETDLEARSYTQPEHPLHVAGVSLPGVPLIVVGHTDHIAWGFTNLGADVQDVYIESLRGKDQQREFRAPDGSWQRVTHLPETILVRGGKNVTLDVTATRHGGALTPVLDPVLTPDMLVQGGKPRSLSLRWTLNDPSVLRLPLLDLARAHDWPSFVQALSTFGGPAQNVVYADDQGHIGYHAAGRVPLRGSPPKSTAPFIPAPATEWDPTLSASPETSGAPSIAASGDGWDPTHNAQATQLSGPLSPVPLIATAAHEWSGYVPYDQLPQAFDPPGGVLATANARVTPDNNPYPITLDWAAPYRNERIWRLLAHRTGLKPADMLALQTDVTSDFDRILAVRLAYAIDHAPTVTGNPEPNPAHSIAAKKLSSADLDRLHHAADLLRSFDGTMRIDSSTAAIVFATHAVLWPMLLRPKLSGATDKDDLQAFYIWGEKDFALEELLEHTPARWLSPPYTNWDDLLTAAVLRGLTAAHAPADLSHWSYGSIHKMEIEHPLFGQYALLRNLLGRPTGTGLLPQSGDTTTIKQVGLHFGPSERFTADLSNPDNGTLNLVLGQSGNPASPWFLDQFPAWYHGTTFPFPFTDPAVSRSTTHTLTLNP